MIDESYYLYLLLTSTAVLLAIACFLLTRFERRCRRIEHFWNSPTGAVLQGVAGSEGHEQTKATQRLEQRFAELQRAVKVMEIKASKQQSRAERKLPLENAVRMAKLGASVEDLTRTCGLNIGEARLMRKLHTKAAMAADGR